MYVCAWDKNGQAHYWRHKRVEANQMFKGRGNNNGRWFSGKGFVQGPDYQEPKPFWWEKPAMTSYTVAECKRELQRHHPDRGGDPKQASIWSARLKAARKAGGES